MKILVFGDSHSVYFTLSNELKAINESFRGVNIKLLSMPGSTILGFGKRESTLNSRDIFYKEVEQFRPDYICFALGQVDIELGFYYRTVVKKEDIKIQSYIEKLVKVYKQTINDIQKDFNIPDSSICVKGVNISVLTNSRDKAVAYTGRIINENITNPEQKAEYEKSLRSLLPSNLERYRNHQLFNSSIRNSILDKYKYFDINDVIMDPNRKGICKLEFIPAGQDHHVLDSLFIREISIKRLISTFLGL